MTDYPYVYDAEKEKAWKASYIQPKKCSECRSSDTDARKFSDCGTRRVMIEKNVCHTCAFWYEKITLKDRYLRVNHVSYHVSPEDAPSLFRGFGGAKFKFRRLDTNEVIVSTNVWCQGDIPPRFRDRLPDNAEQLY